MVITGRDNDRGQAVLNAIRESGSNGRFLAGDLTDPVFCESLIEQALSKTNNVVARAASMLNIRRTTLVEKMRKYQIDRND